LLIIVHAVFIEKNLTFENALSLALGQETAAKNVRALQGAPVETTGDAAVHKVDFNPLISMPQQPARTYTSGKGLCYDAAKQATQLHNAGSEQ